VSCPCCGSERTPQVAALQSGQVHIVRCAACHLDFVDPFVQSGESSSSSNTSQGYIQAMKSQYQELQPLIKHRAAQRLEFYTKLLNRPPKSILEVGSGTGWMVRAYQDAGIQAVGLEIDPELAVIARDVIGADVRKADICSVEEIADLSDYDIVCSSQTLEHILEPRLALKNMTAALKTGGILHIDVPNADSWGARIKRVVHNDRKWGVIALTHHQIGYYPQSMQRIFTDTGLAIVSILERPVDDDVFGQTILPKKALSRLAMQLYHYAGHGYLLVGIARKT
jgi:SAM-dependent methyltransferase